MVLFARVVSKLTTIPLRPADMIDVVLRKMLDLILDSKPLLKILHGCRGHLKVQIGNINNKTLSEDLDTLLEQDSDTSIFVAAHFARLTGSNSNQF